MSAILKVLALGTIAALAQKTDLSGCYYTTAALLTEVRTVTVDGNTQYEGAYSTSSFWWYEPGQEQCQLLDCGGGRAPPATDVPGCPYYSGTVSASAVSSLGFPVATLTLPPNPDGSVQTAAPAVASTNAEGNYVADPAEVEVVEGEAAEEAAANGPRPNSVASTRPSTRTTTVLPQETGESADQEDAAMGLKVTVPALAAVLALSAGLVL